MTPFGAKSALLPLILAGLFNEISYLYVFA